MIVQQILVGILAFLVNVLLLLGTNKLLGCSNRPLHNIVGAGIAVLHSEACLLSGFHFLSSFFWNVVCMLTTALVAFGLERQSIVKCGIFILLKMALSWLAVGAGGGLWMPLFGAFAIFFLCGFVFREQRHAKPMLPVELHYGENNIRIWALRDTGNTLRDPITGKPVLIIGPKVATKLTGLTQKQLENPVETMGVLPGLRLIPYETVGTQNGLLLGLKLANTKIGKWQGSSLVAFAPRGFGEHQAYQGLTGGYL